MKFGKIAASIALLAIPIILVEGALHSRELVITHFTSTLGTVYISAYSIGYTLFNLVLSFNMGLSMGLGVVATRKMGGEDYDGVAQTMVNGYFVGFLLAAILGVVIFNSGFILKSVNEPSELVQLATQFTTMLSFAVLPAVFAAMSQQVVLIIDQPKYIFIFGTITVALIISFSYIFGMGHFGFPRMGMKGFGLAIPIAATFECLCWILLISFHPELRRFPFRKKLLSIKFSVIGDILWTGLPLGVKQIIGINGMIWAFTLILGKLGTINLAVFQLLISFTMMTSAVPNGVARIVAIKVGKQLGALHLTVARLYSNAGFLITFVVVALVGLIMFFIPNQIIGLLLSPINQEEQQVFQVAANLLHFFGGVGILAGSLVIIGSSVLAGFKDTLFTLIAEVGCVWGISLPVGYFLNEYFHGGVRDYWIGLFVGLSVCFVIYLFRIRYQFRKSSQLVANHKGIRP